MSAPPVPFLPVAIIRKKRDGGELSREELAALLDGYLAGQVPDYQMAAWLMAVVWRGMTPAETFHLTNLMAASGRRLQLARRGAVADKHSTGGVGDKVSLVVVPLLAACGLPCAKMSGRGLGHTGGTIDKLESIPGLRTALDEREFLAVLDRCGCVLASQSADLAPADGKLYALRDVTGTVESLPLIASSIMSKKLAVGATALLLDVKVGSGAFLKTLAEARALAEAMVAIGRAAGIATRAALTDMDQPLGSAAGNALEVAEAIAALQGDGPADLHTLAVAEAGELLHLAGRVPDPASGRARAEAALRDGSAAECFRALIAAQGGDPQVVDQPGLLPVAPHREVIAATADGYLAAIATEDLGWALVRLGAGRARKGDPIDPAVGIVLRRKVGAAVAAGEPLAEVHCRGPLAPALRARLAGCFAVAPAAPLPRPLIHALI